MELKLKNLKIQKQENKQGNGSVLPVSQSQIPFLFTYILKESTASGMIFPTRQAPYKAQYFSCAYRSFKQYEIKKLSQ